MNKTALVNHIRTRQTCLCVGLDLHPSRLPSHISQNASGWLDFNRQIIDATRDLCVAYKPNWAFYEALGLEAIEVLLKTIDYIGDEHLIIADAKRGDIGNTSSRYAQAVFEYFKADAITVSPYMGIDSLEPFRSPGKWLVALALTSNPGSLDFQTTELKNGHQLYEEVLDKLSRAFSKEEMMFVVGATHPGLFKKIRQIIPEHFLLVPGVGAQGGDLRSVMVNGMNSEIGLLINSSRSILYASDGKDFADAARGKALDYRNEMKGLISS
ncbi:MAG: orotidine-5'-phosphate decarboxylase [Saprospiraceae bacterium]|nr:orotidine-5'-phosphate decarboxylase [Saprospiraceae bacterium]